LPFAQKGISYFLSLVYRWFAEELGVCVGLALYLLQHKNFVWFFEHMLLQVECVRFDLCKGSVLFQTERWVCFLLYVLVIYRMISTTEDKLDITRAFFSVALVCQVVTCTFYASRFEMAIIFSVLLSLTVCTLSCGGCRWQKHNPTKSVAQPLFTVQVSLMVCQLQ
jgi:hypothetical protein